MSGPARHSRASALIDLFACFLIPAYTLLFAGGVRWLGTNFSVLAVTGPGHYRGFFLWGLLAGGYFLAVLAGVSRTLGSRPLQWALCALSLAAWGCLAGALALPYLPEELPRCAGLHVTLAFTACVLLMAAILAALLGCRREDPLRYRPLLRAWWLIVLVCAALFCLAGIISSALEVFFTISAVLLVRKLWQYRAGGA